MITKRKANITRQTQETSIDLNLNLDGQGKSHIDLPIPFLQHMLEQLVKYSLFDLNLVASGDIAIDEHHLVEDVGISLGQAVKKAIATGAGICRYANAYVPLDEALTRVVVDFSGRPGLVFNVDFVRQIVGKFDTDLVREFFQGFVNHAAITLHVDNIRGTNSHHQAESVFKAWGLVMRRAVSYDSARSHQVPSTKGVL